MKLSAHAFTRFWDLHAWTGVVASLVLYVMFVAGGVTLFHEHLEVWEEPLAQRAAVPRSLQDTLDQALAARPHVPDDFWFFPARAGRGEARIGFEDGGAWRTFWLDSSTGRLVPERERLAHFIYEIHFLWHEVTGAWLYDLAGLLAVALLLALVTGVLIHLKDLVRQFHQFRPHRSRRVLWSDLHKVLGVMGLPFQLMYAYTGAFIVLSPLLLKVFTGPVFAGDHQRATAMAWGTFGASDADAGAPAAVRSLDQLVQQARVVRPDLRPEFIHVMHHGRANGVVDVGGSSAGTPRARLEVRVRQVDGAVLATPREGPAASARRWINGLHFAHFGGLPVRFLFFALTLAGCATLLTGNWIWLARRPATRGNQVLARLTVGVGAGTWVALGALFLASRALPLDWGGRRAAEELAFLSALAACIGWAFVTRAPASLWCRQLAVAAGLLLVTAALSTGRHGIGPRPTVVAAVDVGIVASALLLGLVGLLLRRTASRRVPATTPDLQPRQRSQRSQRSIALAPSQEGSDA